jgi:hypothetical protein
VTHNSMLQQHVTHCSLPQQNMQQRITATEHAKVQGQRAAQSPHGHVCTTSHCQSTY